MNIPNIARTARIYARSEALVAKIQARVYARKAAFAAVALLLGAIALVFLNLAAFVYLQSIWGPIWAPLVIGLANLAAAALAAVIAILTHPGPDLALARELRDSAGRALEEEFHASTTMGTLAGMVGGKADAGLNSLLLPVIISIVGAITRRKAAAKK
ncbi:MAG: hypothetical protein KGO53_04165 [Alphaproteobacteria bacterium]|nr:hypothetical protein [Alphaproteobacteria bacterium]